ncbi:MAG: nitroreductase/quinone reductase family protein [Gammaproteobacteria bacterium]
MTEPNEAKDALHELPPAVRAEIAAHHELYLRDPAAAHLWDPIVIGVPGGAVPCLLLWHTGRRSGRRLNTILQYYRMDGQVAIVASRGGTVDHPAWYLNLDAEPACEFWIGAARHAGRARTVSGAERERWWARITAEQPMQLTYQARTSREIPVVVLEPAAAD